MTAFLRRVVWWVQRRRKEQELDEELQFHLDEEADDRRAEGLPDVRARQAAHRDLGNVAVLREDTRVLWTWTTLEQIVQDVRYGLRALGAKRIVSAMVILSLGLGIGANAAIFSLINSLLLRSLPVAEPERLAIVSSDRAIAQARAALWTYGVWDQLRQRGDEFEGLAAWWSTRVNLSAAGGEAQSVDGLYVNGSFFTTLGVPSLLGRTLTAADDVPGSGTTGPAVVISHDFWQRHFGGNDRIIGTSLVVERVPCTIVGVTPQSFFGAEVGKTFDVALPLAAEPVIRGSEAALMPNRPMSVLTIMLRLMPGQSLTAANAFLRGVQPQIREGAMPQGMPAQMQANFMNEPFTAVSAASGTSRLRAQYEQAMITLWVVVTAVLLIACANVANLQLAQASARRQEFSVRLALGAPRRRLVRQLLVESLVLSSLGAVLGVPFAMWASRALVAQLSTATSRVVLSVDLDWRVLAFTAAVAVTTAVLSGTAPAWTAARVDPIEPLRERGPSGAGLRPALSSGLVIGQIVLSLMLVVAAGLLLQTFQRLATKPLGFDRDRVLLVSVDLTPARLTEPERLSVAQRLVDNLKAMGGVEHAAASTTTPIAGLGIIDTIRRPDMAASAAPMRGGVLDDHSTYVNVVTPGWFATYGFALRAGRDIEERDTKGSAPVVVVNEAFVRKFMVGEDPIGASIQVERGRPAPVTKTIVGVVSDSVYGSLREPASPIEFVPLAQLDAAPIPANLTISVRASAGSPMLLTQGLAAAMTAVNRDLTFSFRPLAEQVDVSLTRERLIATLAGCFGLLSLLLAALGLYGLASYTISRRRTEIGIRMALGAAPDGVVRLVLWRILRPIAVGVIVGVAASVSGGSLVASLLYGVEPRDPFTIAGAVSVLAGVGLVAGWLPARRTSRIDPAQLLRES